MHSPCRRTQKMVDSACLRDEQKILQSLQDSLFSDAGLELYYLHFMFDELNAVMNDLVEALFAPFTKILLGKNQQVFDDIATTYGLISDDA